MGDLLDTKTFEALVNSMFYCDGKDRQSNIDAMKSWIRANFTEKNSGNNVIDVPALLMGVAPGATTSEAT